MRGTDTSCEPELLRQALCVPGAKLCARGNGMPHKTRRYVVTGGFGPDHNLGVYNNNTHTIQRAFVERYFLCLDNGVYRPALRVDDFEYTRSHHLQMFRSAVNQHMPRLPRLSRQQVVDRYTGKKHAVYTRALESLARESLSVRDARLTSFVKFEKQDVGKAPRIINPRTPRYNLCLGTYLKHAEKPFFKAINKVFGNYTPATVIKGYNADVSASILKQKWDRFSEPVAVGLDATKFDMHVSVPALRYEHSFYKDLFPGSENLRFLLNLQLNNSGTAYAQDGEVSFSMKGTRCSGDLNTSLGNCLIMCADIWAFFQEQMVDVELANNGDDCVVIFEREYLERIMQLLPAWFRKKGFAMTVEPPVYEFEHIEFCQTKPVKLGTGWRLVRNHLAVLKKDPMCLIPINGPETYQKWLWAVGTGGSILAKGTPVQSAFYAAMLRGGKECSQGMIEEVYRGTSMLTRVSGLTTIGAITPEARVSYYYAFGVTPDQQLELERYYNQLAIQPIVMEEISRDALVLEPGLSLLLSP